MDIYQHVSNLYELIGLLLNRIEALEAVLNPRGE